MVALRSPGVVVREQDLTTGRADISNGNTLLSLDPSLKVQLEYLLELTAKQNLFQYLVNQMLLMQSIFFVQSTTYFMEVL